MTLPLFQTSISLERLKAHLRKRYGLRSGRHRVRTLSWFESADGALGRSGKLLTHEADELALYEVESFPEQAWIRTPWTGTPETIQWRAIDSGPMREALGRSLDLRAALRGGTHDLIEDELAILNADRKTVVRLLVLHFDPARNGTAPPTGCQLRIHPVRGYADELGQFIDFITTDRAITEGFAWPALLDGSTIRARGYGAGCSLNLPITPSVSGIEATSRMIRELIGLMRANVKGIIDDIDTEFLHDYRVSLRKVRSILSLVRGVYASETTCHLKRQFGDIARQTNRLRDLDVYLLERAAYRNRLPASLRDGLEAFFGLLEIEREQQWRELVDYLQSETYRTTVRDLQEQFSVPGQIEPGANASVSALELSAAETLRHFRKLRTIGNRLHASTPHEDVHKLRIEAKKLRYLIELFEPLYPTDAVARLLKRLKQLQNTLGQFNDHEVQQAFLLDFLQRNPTASTRMAASIGGLVSLLHRAQADARAEVEKRFARFNDDATCNLVHQIYTT